MNAASELVICVVIVDEKDEEHVFHWNPNAENFGTTPNEFLVRLKNHTLEYKTNVFKWFESIAHQPGLYDDTDQDSPTFTSPDFGHCHVPGDSLMFYQSKQWDWMLLMEGVYRDSIAIGIVYQILELSTSADE